MGDEVSQSIVKVFLHARRLKCSALHMLVAIQFVAAGERESRGVFLLLANTPRCATRRNGAIFLRLVEEEWIGTFWKVAKYLPTIHSPCPMPGRCFNYSKPSIKKSHIEIHFSETSRWEVTQARHD